MTLRERERFLKLSKADYDDCIPGEAGWLSVIETKEGGAVIEMTTDEAETLKAIVTWAAEQDGLAGKLEITSEGNKYVFLENGEPMPFEQVMNIVNNFR